MNSQYLPELGGTRKDGKAANGRCTVRALISAALLTCLASGCGSAVECDWSATERCGASGDNLAGTWEGTWESHDRGYRRTLRAEFTSCGDGEYRGKYETMFGSVVPLEYESLHSTTGRGSVTRFSGTTGQNCLLPAGCRYDGAADGSTLVINYVSAKDFGVIRLTRARSAGDRGVSQALAYVSGHLLH